MPKAKFQRVIFSAMMVFVTVFYMTCYTVSFNFGGFSYKVLNLAIQWSKSLISKFPLIDQEKPISRSQLTNLSQKSVCFEGSPLPMKGCDPEIYQQILLEKNLMTFLLQGQKESRKP